MVTFFKYFLILKKMKEDIGLNQRKQLTFLCDIVHSFDKNKF